MKGKSLSPLKNTKILQTLNNHVRYGKADWRNIYKVLDKLWQCKKTFQVKHWRWRLNPVGKYYFLLIWNYKDIMTDAINKD